MVSAQDKADLLRFYKRCRVYHGELHDHSNSGGTSDGKCPIEEWPAKMRALHMDFAAILDHKQVRHMYQPAWRDGLFIPGTEPGTTITDSTAEVPKLHYNILLPKRGDLAKLLAEFPEYAFTGGVEGHFIYPTFTRERFCELIDAVKARGGLFVHPHPKQKMQSTDPLDYWFRDETAIEVFYEYMTGEHTEQNYALWCELLAKGKRLWASAGCDLHIEPHDTALTTLYAERHSAKAYLPRLAVGDFTCGPVGIRMCLGTAKTGGQCKFDGQRLVVCVGDFHVSVKDPTHTYRADVLNDRGVAFSAPVRPDETTWFAYDADATCAFYRVEIFDETRDLRIAVGNPIWNVAD